MNQNPQFPSTLWSRILNAKDPNSPEVGATFAGLCQAYWYPIYVYFRHLGRPHGQAEALTQDYLAFAFQQRAIRRADRSLGRFRDYLKQCLRNFNTDAVRNRLNC